MRKKAAGAHRLGSPMRRAREVVMSPLSTLLVALARAGLLAALLLRALMNAFADAETADPQ
jgi:hypothetical protein